MNIEQLRTFILDIEDRVKNIPSDQTDALIVIQMLLDTVSQTTGWVMDVKTEFMAMATLIKKQENKIKELLMEIENKPRIISLTDIQ